jgi:hypothetical protein
MKLFYIIYFKELGNSGYPFANLTGKATVNTETNSARVFFRLDAKNTLRTKAGFEREKFESYTNRKIFGTAGLDGN